MMSISIMKLADEYFGKVAVFILMVFNKLSRKKNEGFNVFKNILFIKFWGLGSIVLTIPALNKVKSAYPDSKIYFLTLQNNMQICNETDIIDETVTINISNIFSFIHDFIKKILYLRKTNFQIVFDFEFYTYFSAIITALIKSGFSIGFDNLKSNRKELFSKTILFNDGIHAKDNFINLVDVDKYVNIIPENANFFNAWGGINNRNGDFKIIINPNVSRLAYERRLPGEMFIELINHITKNYSCKVYMTGSETDVNHTESIYQRLDNKSKIDNLCGKTSVKKLIELIKLSDCVITCDSGPLHIASAYNIPVISFFGPESPQRYGPLSSKSLIFYKNLKCSPCMSINNSKTVNCIYDSPKCMEQFDAEDVLRKIDLFLNSLFILNKNVTEEIPSFDLKHRVPE